MFINMQDVKPTSNLTKTTEVIEIKPVSKKSGLSQKTKIYIAIAIFLALSLIITVAAITYVLLYVKNNDANIIIKTDNNAITTTVVPSVTVPITISNTISRAYQHQVYYQMQIYLILVCFIQQ